MGLINYCNYTALFAILIQLISYANQFVLQVILLQPLWYGFQTTILVFNVLALISFYRANHTVKEYTKDH